MYEIELTKYASIWQHVTRNPQGGSYGSSNRGSRADALFRALRGVPEGAEYRLIINGKDRGVKVRQSI